MVPAAAEGRRLHREGCHAVAARLESMGALAEHLDVARAGAVLATCTAPGAIEGLTAEHGWSFDEVEAWLTTAIGAATREELKRRRLVCLSNELGEPRRELGSIRRNRLDCHGVTG